MATVWDVYEHLIEPPSVVTVEHLVWRILVTAPTFRNRFVEVLNAAGEPLSDIETDSFNRDFHMVAQRRDGQIAAILCTGILTEGTLDRFLNATQTRSDGRTFAERLVFTSTSEGHVALPEVEPPIELFDPDALMALEPPTFWKSLFDDEDVPAGEDLSRIQLAANRPPRAAVQVARKHVRDALDGIQDVTRELEGRLDRRELGEAEEVELRLLREVVRPTLQDLNERLDVVESSEIRFVRTVLKRLAGFFKNPTVPFLLGRLAEHLNFP